MPGPWPDLSFVGLEVILNSVSPVLNLGLFVVPGNLYSGISKVPSTLPAALVIKGLPATIVASLVYELEAGVMKALTSCLSKNT